MLRVDAGYRRRRVFDRDKGVCAACGRDTIKLQKRVSRIFRKFKHKGSMHIIYRIKRLTGLDAAYSVWDHPWEADHIVEQSAGGDSNMENLQTLCLVCHRRKTAAMHRRNAMLRKEVPPKYLEKAAGDWDLPLFSGAGNQRVRMRDGNETLCR